MAIERYRQSSEASRFHWLPAKQLENLQTGLRLFTMVGVIMREPANKTMEDISHGQTVTLTSYTAENDDMAIGASAQ